METFEFIVEGPAVSLKAKKSNAKPYQNWIRTVRVAAQKEWQTAKRPTNSQSVVVHITNYHTLSPPDVDNIIKPLLDAIETVAYKNDRQVYKVISEKLDLSDQARIKDLNELVETGLAKYTELLHIVVTWNEED